MTHHLFFSWQSDTTNKIGRNFIERCLERAIGELQADADVELANREIAIDRDTRDVPGSPPIMETIFAKIDAADVFLADMTYVATRPKGEKSPNPNVCVEHGYALKALSWRRVVAVMNTALGHPEQHELPFDLRYARWPILFELAEDAGDEARNAARERLVRELKSRLRAIFGDEVVRAEMRGGATGPHPHDIELLARVYRQLSPPLRLFLHQHNFGTPYAAKKLELLHEMNEVWVGAAYEFHDQEVQAAFAEVRKAAQAFGTLILERIYAMPGSTTMLWPKTNRDLEVGIQPSTEKAIRDMNALAGVLSDAIDAFDRVARDHIPVASGAHAVEVADPAEAGRGGADDVRREVAQAAINDLAFDANRGGAPEIVTRPRLSLRFAPFAAADARPLNTREVAVIQRLFAPNDQDEVKADTDGRQWWSCKVPLKPDPQRNPETRWCMRLVRPGCLEFQAQIGALVENDEVILIDGRRVEAMIISNLERMARITAELGLGGPAIVSAVLDGVEAVELTGKASRRPLRLRRPEVFLPTLELADPAVPLGGPLQETFDILWQTAGLVEGSPSYEAGDWAGYADDRHYRADPWR
jgi:hypothetical protein